MASLARRHRAVLRWLLRLENSYVLFSLCVLSLTLLLAGNDLGMGSGRDLRGQFLSAAMGSTAAVAAITLSISVVAVQHAASAYSPSVITRLRSDGMFWSTLVFAAFSIGLMAMIMLHGACHAALGLLYLLGTLLLVGLFFLHTIGRISPVSVAAGIRKRMLDDCAWLREHAGECVIRTDGRMQDGPFKERHKGLDDTAMGLRQLTVSSFRRSDYTTGRECLVAYEKVAVGYARAFPHGYPDDGMFLRALFVDLENYCTKVARDEVLARFCITRSYRKIGVAFAGDAGAGMTTLDAGRRPIDVCLGSLRKVWRHSVVNGESDMEEYAIACVGGIGKRSCLQHGGDQGALDMILAMAGDGAVKSASGYTQLASVLSSLKILGAMIRGPPGAGTEGGGVPGAIGRISDMAADLAVPSQSGVWDDRYYTHGISSAAVRCVASALGPAAGGGRGPCGLPAGLIDMLGEVASFFWRSGDANASLDAVRFMSAAAWILAREGAAGPEAECGGEIRRIVEMLEVAQAERTEARQHVIESVALIAVHCCAYWSGDAVDECVGAIGRIAGGGVPARDVEAAMALLGLIGGCLAGAGRDAHSERAVGLRDELARRYEAKHGPAPPYDAPGLREALLEGHSGTLAGLLPEGHAGAYEPLESVMRLACAREGAGLPGGPARGPGP